MGVWVGNFNGGPMRHVSGVTGAAPLWNRIMLRLAQRREPARFSAPAGMVRRPICSTTGLRPDRACPARVWEYISPSQLAEYKRRPQRTYPHAYDQWLAAQGLAATARSDVRLLFPHPDDVFVLNKTDDAIQVAPTQAIAFVMRALPHTSVTWRLNGKIVATTAGNTFEWTLRLGRWHLDAQSGPVSDSVTFQVVPAASHPLRGFTF